MAKGRPLSIAIIVLLAMLAFLASLAALSFQIAAAGPVAIVLAGITAAATLGLWFNRRLHTGLDRSEQPCHAPATAVDVAETDPDSGPAPDIARIRAEQANEAKSNFLRTVSHEMRTPLNGILGLSALLRQTRLTPEQISYANAIETSGNALLLLVEDLLDFARIEAGRIDIHLSPCNLVTNIEELVESLAPRAFAKGIELAGWVEPSLAQSYLVDMPRLKQVLGNLIGNAIKFTSKGGVTVEAFRVAASANRAAEAIRFRVLDTGIGIAEADSRRIFQEFEQVDHGATRLYEGSGLGLTIARRLVRMMGGTIRLESTLGLGSCFEFDLELAVGPCLAGNTDHMPGKTPENAAANAQPATIGPHRSWQRLSDAFRLADIDPGRQTGEAPPHPSHPLSPQSNCPRAGAHEDGPTADGAQPDLNEADFSGQSFVICSANLVEAPLMMRHLIRLGASVAITEPAWLDDCLGRAPDYSAIIVDTTCGNPEDTLRRIRAIHPATPLAIALKPSEREQLPHWQDIGYKAFLIKPVRAATLKGVVQFLLGHRNNAPRTTIAVDPVWRRTDCPLTVLVCDDNEINILLARALLEKIGHRVLVAQGGQCAVNIYIEASRSPTPVDVVLMDLHMPQMDGYQTLQLLRNAARERLLPPPTAIALTADVMNDTPEHCLREGFLACLGKPLDREALTCLLDRLSPRGQPAVPSPAPVRLSVPEMENQGFFSSV